MKKDKEIFLTIDSNSIIHRSFYALPPLKTKKGEPMGAVYGFFLVLFKVVKEFHPKYVTATFDYPAPTFRHKKYKDYKIKRKKAPPELYDQIKVAKKILKAFRIPIFEKKGVEADDLVGAISRLASRRQKMPPLKVIILSGDLDILQLVDSNTEVYVPGRGSRKAILYDTSKVQERYQGLAPSQLPDFKGLRGDPSDDIPGVPGVGPKTAIKLLSKFEKLENLYQEIEQESGLAQDLRPKLRQSLLEYKEQAFLSKSLAKIKTNLELDFSLKECRFKEFNLSKVIEIFKTYEFNTLIKRLKKLI